MRVSALNNRAVPIQNETTAGPENGYAPWTGSTTRSVMPVANIRLCRQPHDQHFVDPVAIHIHDLMPNSAIFKGSTGLWDPSHEEHNQPGNGPVLSPFFFRKGICGQDLATRSSVPDRKCHAVWVARSNLPITNRFIHFLS